MDKNSAINYCIQLLNDDIVSFQQQKMVETTVYRSTPDTDPEDAPFKYCKYLCSIDNLDKKIKNYEQMIEILVQHSKS